MAWSIDLMQINDWLMAYLERRPAGQHVRGLRDVSGVQTVVIRHVAVVVFFHQRQIVHEHLLRNF